MLKSGLSAIALLFGMATLGTSANANEAKGVWLTESKKAHVEIYDCASKLCGKIVWLKEPNDEGGKPKVDVENPDKSKRSEPLMGSNMISGMAKVSSVMWNEGEIYDPEDGKTYASKMELANDKTLKVSGCVFVFCEAQTWQRVE